MWSASKQYYTQGNLSCVSPTRRDRQRALVSRQSQHGLSRGLSCRADSGRLRSSHSPGREEKVPNKLYKFYQVVLPLSVIKRFQEVHVLALVRFCGVEFVRPYTLSFELSGWPTMTQSRLYQTSRRGSPDSFEVNTRSVLGMTNTSAWLSTGRTYSHVA